jgi:hypothetical protein
VNNIGIHARGGNTGRNLRNVWTFATQPYKGAHFACVDEETECLTAEGWKKYNELKIGELAAQFDLEAGTFSWGRIEDVFSYAVNNQEMVRSNTRDMDMLLTPNHRCVVYRRHPRTRAYQKPLILSASSLRASHSFPTSAPWGEQLPFADDPGKDWAELFGWYVAEGHQCRNSLDVEIYQSLAANPDRVVQIRSLLLSVAAEFLEATGKREWRGRPAHQTVFRIKGYTAARLRQFCPEKKLPESHLLWSTESASSLLRGLVEGDGNTRKDDRRCFIQKSYKTASDVQALAIRCGLSATLTGRADGMNTVYLTVHRMRSFRGSNGRGSPPTRTTYTGIIWCPRLPQGTWVARRNGRVFVTGNTFPEELVRRCIAAGTSERGCCPECGAPWVRIVNKKRLVDGEETVSGGWQQNEAGQIGANGKGHWRITSESKTLGWRPTCHCIGHYARDSGWCAQPRTAASWMALADSIAPEFKPVPCVVLDPFAGSGTVGEVAYKMGRSAVVIDLAYQDLQRERIPPMAFAQGTTKRKRGCI